MKIRKRHLCEFGLDEFQLVYQKIEILIRDSLFLLEFLLQMLSNILVSMRSHKYAIAHIVTHIAFLKSTLKLNSIL